MIIRETTPDDLDNVLRIEREAFGEEDEARLVNDMLDDPSAQPSVSLLALDDSEQAVGHILFTHAVLDPASDLDVVILAPLAIVPGSQKQGIGSALVRRGLDMLREAGADLVFVLGHPGYYPRHGFEPAMPHGMLPPFDIPESHAEAWMVQALRPGAIEEGQGRVVCADTLNKVEYWRE